MYPDESGRRRLRLALFVSLGYDAKGEKRPALLVRHFHPQFRTSFNGMV